MNYTFSYKRFSAHKTVLGEHLCKWETVPVKEQTCTLLIILWNSGRKCAKLVFKPFAVNPSSSVLCIAPFVQITLFQLIWCLFSILVHSAIYLHSSATIFNEFKWEAVNLCWPWTSNLFLKIPVQLLFRAHVVDLFFIVTHVHQKIKALFCCINFDYTTNFVKKCFVFLSIFIFFWV